MSDLSLQAQLDALPTGTSLQQELIRLQAENAALKAAKSAPKSLSIKVSEKGAISIYGLGRFPVTLYRTQMERLIGHVPQIEAFIAANVAKLTVKEEAAPVVQG